MRVVVRRSCLAGAAGAAPRVGQPSWACVDPPANPVLLLEGAERGESLLVGCACCRGGCVVGVFSGRVGECGRVVACR